MSMPYYFALAPNYDFTFNPLYMSRQGILWQGEWRHRLENGQYYIKLAGIDQNPNDLPSTIVDPDKYAGFRGSIETKGLFSLASWWHFGWDVTAASDDTFRRFYKLDNILATDVRQQSVPQRHFRPQLLQCRGGSIYQPAVSGQWRGSPS